MPTMCGLLLEKPGIHISTSTFRGILCPLVAEPASKAASAPLYYDCRFQVLVYMDDLAGRGTFRIEARNTAIKIMSDLKALGGSIQHEKTKGVSEPTTHLQVLSLRANRERVLY